MTSDWTSDARITDQQRLEQVVLFYRQRLQEHAPAKMYLEERGLTAPGLIEPFEIGFADRGLGRALPKPQLKAGKRIRGQLQRLGIYRPTGHGHFNGSLTVPIRNGRREIADLYGRKIGRNLVKGTELHKILAISEEEGVAEAAYALKLSQSDGRWTIATAEKEQRTAAYFTAWQSSYLSCCRPTVYLGGTRGRFPRFVPEGP